MHHVRRVVTETTPAHGLGDFGVRGVGEVWVDEGGLGGGVLDRLVETLPSVRWQEAVRGSLYDDFRTVCPRARAFNAAKASPSNRYRNLRAHGYWMVRKLMEEEAIALPDVPELRRELLATRVRFAPDGKIEIEPKDAIRSRLGHSPDHADALVASLGPLLKPEMAEWKRVQFI
jgi:hypothetical protein